MKRMFCGKHEETKSHFLRDGWLSSAPYICIQVLLTICPYVQNIEHFSSRECNLIHFFELVIKCSFRMHAL